MKFTGKWGMRVLAVWLILYGLMALLGLHFSHSGEIMAVLALVAGVLVLLDR